MQLCNRLLAWKRLNEGKNLFDSEIDFDYYFVTNFSKATETKRISHSVSESNLLKNQSPRYLGNSVYIFNTGTKERLTRVFIHLCNLASFEVGELPLSIRIISASIRLA